MSVVIILQARMTSTRLPGKVLMPVLGKPLLTYQLERLQRVSRADKIVVATTINVTDDPIAALSCELGVSCYRGSEPDVLARYYEAALKSGATTVVRVTGDCPLIDPTIIDELIQTYQDAGGAYDYVSNTLERSYPRGVDAEVFSFSALEKAYQQARLPGEREHVTPYIYRNPDSYACKSVRNVRDLGHHRWTVDTIEDFQLVKKILTMLYPVQREFTMAQVEALLAEHPELERINAHIAQKAH